MSTTGPDLQQPQLPEAEQQVDLRAYWRIVSKRRWMILATFVLAVVIAAAYALRLPKIYSAQATIVIEMASPKVLGQNNVQDVAESSAPIWFGKEYYETQF